MIQPHEKYFLGVDGGNSKTIALVAAAGARIVGAGRGGCADIYASCSTDAALGSVDAAVEAALQNAGLKRSDLAAAAFSLAGADWPEDVQFLEEALGRYAPKTIVFNDAIGAILAGSPEGWGASAVCGTGSNAGARSPEGKTWHCGFWHDNSCGASQLGDAAIAAVLRSELKIQAPTRLTELLLKHYQQSSVEEMLHAHTRRSNRLPRNSPALARLVLDAAAEADAVAFAIVQEQAASAAQHAIAAARNVGILDRPFPLVLAGGVFRHPGHLLHDTLVQHVRAHAPHAQPIKCNIEPVAGALLAAIQLAGHSLTPELRERLHQTHPPASLFQT